MTLLNWFKVRPMGAAILNGVTAISTVSRDFKP